MKSYNFYYLEQESLRSFIETHAIFNSSSLLIQVFTSKSDRKFIKKILDSITLYLPDAYVIGTTTDGEIMSGRVSENRTVISITQFENSSLDVIWVEHSDRGYKSGQEVAKTLIKQETKAIISFGSCYNTSGEEYLYGISSVNDEVVIAGGIAGHDETTTDSYVFTKDKILSKGVVAVSLQSENLVVHNDYSYNWVEIGVELTINEVIDNRVYKIDGRTAYDTYVHYLGKDIAEHLPSSGTEFPLIIKRDDFLISRAVIDVHKDGSLSFAGDFSVGDIVQFGYGDIKSIHQKSTEIAQGIAKKPAEAIFIYSCLARRHYLGDSIENETLPLESIAPTVGFFTHGEFYSTKRKEFLNQTMTLLVLSETKKVQKVENLEAVSREFTDQAISINALANLINVVSSEIKEHRKELEKQKNLFEILFEKSSDGILILEGMHFVQCNEKAYQLMGYNSKEELLSLHPKVLSPKYQPDGMNSVEKAKKMMQLALEKGMHQFEWVHTKADSTPLWVEVRLSPLVIENREYIYVGWRDIGERKELQLALMSQKESLYHQANHDSLTDLANRNLFYIKLEDSINKAKRESKKLALLFIDLDMFKDINDSLGHDVGDALLQEVATRLKSSLRAEDTVARIGGDEFTIIIESVQDIQDVAQKANKLLNEISKPYLFENHTIYITCSIGISIYPDDTESLTNLIKFADTAMYKAKEEGRNRQWFYSNEMTAIISNRIKIDNEMREAVHNEEFEVYYQPFIDTKEQKIVGAEALIRWKHPKNGLIFPDSFIPVAEKSDLIIDIDNWMMQRSMKEFAKWYEEGLNPGILSLNLAIKQLESPTYIERLIFTMEKYSFKPSWLKLEILERHVMQKAEENILKLEKIRSLGIALAMDDFGTGESSFTYLRKFPISQIKIDKSFVMGMQKERDNKEIVKAIIALGNALKLEVIAEGVESVEDKEYLMRHECFLMQGYYFSKPIQREAFREFLTSKSLLSCV